MKYLLLNSMKPPLFCRRINLLLILRPYLVMYLKKNKQANTGTGWIKYRDVLEKPLLVIKTYLAR